jgi:hypothetical protein
MSDLFTSLVSVSPTTAKLSGREAERIPGISPSMKDGIWAERASAPTGTYITPKMSSLNAVVIP